MAPRLDRAALHRLLWQMRYSNGTIRIVQADLAQELAISKFTLNRVLVTMEDEQRIKRVSGSRANVNTYLVTDPDTWTKP